jgi:outer membrane protein W
MKKINLIVFLFVCIGKSILAQVTDMPASEFSLKRVELGVRFMPTFSKFAITTASNGTVKGDVTLGYGGGVTLAFNFSKYLGLQTGVIYNSFSQKYKDKNLDRQIKVSYVNIPLLLSINTNKTKPVNFNVMLGPELGLNIGSSVKSTSGSSKDTLTGVLAVKGNDFGVAYGAGLEFMLNEKRTLRFDVGYRGIYGLTNISNTSQSVETNSYYIINKANIRSNSVYVGLALLF